MAQTETQPAPATTAAAAEETTGETTENQEAAQDTTETAAATTTATTENTEAEAPAEPEEISYHAVEKEGHVTAIWEMQGRKHIRTIDPRSNEGKQILELFETAG